MKHTAEHSTDMELCKLYDYRISDSPESLICVVQVAENILQRHQMRNQDKEDAYPLPSLHQLTRSEAKTHVTMKDDLARFKIPHACQQS